MLFTFLMELGTIFSIKDKSLLDEDMLTDSQYSLQVSFLNTLPGLPLVKIEGGGKILDDRKEGEEGSRGSKN